jgi:hypothetical protein
MSFPGIFNINYYRGDTYEFNVFPKDSSGNVFDMSTFPGSEFVISEERGAAAIVTAYSVISDDKTHVKCAIRPVDALLLDAEKTYVYDVQISRSASPYDFVYTLLTGNVNITEQVSAPAPVSLPNAPINLTLSEDPVGTLKASWEAPLDGDPPTAYNIYGKADSLGLPYVFITSVPASQTEFSASEIAGFPLQTDVEYGVKITSVNAAGENTESFVEGTIILAGEEESPEAIVEDELPGAPTNLVLVENPAGVLNASWSPPESEPYPVAYNVYGKVDSFGIPYTLLGTVPAETPGFSSALLEEPLQIGVEYGIKVVSVNELAQEGGFVEGAITLLGE